MAAKSRDVFARNLKRLMDTKGVNAKTICDELNIPSATFSDWCHAKTYPRIDKIEKLANYFNISTAELVGDHQTKIIQKSNFNIDVLSLFSGNQQRFNDSSIEDAIEEAKNALRNMENMTITIEESEIIDSYRKSDDLTQAMVRRTLGIE